MSDTKIYISNILLESTKLFKNYIVNQNIQYFKFFSLSSSDIPTSPDFEYRIAIIYLNPQLIFSWMPSMIPKFEFFDCGLY